MNKYYFFIERLISEDDKVIKLSSIPFNVITNNNMCELLMIRDINFSFITNPNANYIFRIIAVKADSINFQKELSDLLNFLQINNNKFNNLQNKFILLKQFKMKMNMRSDDDSYVKYKDDDITCKFWKHEVKDGNFYYSNPQINIEYNKLIELINNFII